MTDAAEEAHTGQGVSTPQACSLPKGTATGAKGLSGRMRLSLKVSLHLHGGHD